jgi:hypothetical protein
MYTRWGQYKPLAKCMAMSLFAHLLLASYAATVQIITPATPKEQVFRVSFGDGPGDLPADDGPAVAAVPGDEPRQVMPVETVAKPAPKAEDSGGAKLLRPIAVLPAATETDPPQPLGEVLGTTNPMRVEPSPAIGRSEGLSSLRAAREEHAEPAVPNAFRLRVARDRSGIVWRNGGGPQTEAAVQAALKWFADNQAADGRWDPRAHGAGRESNVQGRDRQSAGSHADTGMTGLALLSYLASGHTHRDGPYRDDVRRGVEFLMRTQSADGSLGGQAASFEFMYCHAMASCALGEAYGMTGDERLGDAARRAIGYTVAAQDPIGGSWRYRPGEAGDTSQLGWQLMALKSAELAGIPIPEATRQGIARFLRSVSSGRRGGLASYRPGELATRTMTAEALVCWQFLGLARSDPACDEAGDWLLGELPGQGAYNLYYWYYGTLGMFQLQGVHWQRWNEALRSELLARQVKDGQQAGSWDPNDLWGSHGGRIYSTALATLALEVYYRFLPIYGGMAGSGVKGTE